MIARTRCPRVWASVRPMKQPRASGSACGVRSPERYGRKNSPWLPAGAVCGLLGQAGRRRRASPAWPRPCRPGRARCGTTAASRRPKGSRPSCATCRGRRGRTCGSGPRGRSSTSSLWTNITPEVPIEVESMPLADDAVADRPGRAIARPADHDAVGRQAQQLRPPRASACRSRLPTRSTRPSRSTSSSSADEQLLRPSPPGHVQQQHAAGVAHVGGVLAGQAAADFVLRQQAPCASRLEVPRLVVPQPEDFRGGEAGQRRVGDHLDQLRPAAGAAFDLVALGGGPLIVPEDGRGG